MRKMCAPLFVIMLLLAFGTYSRPALAQTTPLATARLAGADEVPNSGDSDGSGSATVTFKPDSGEVCWDITVANITLPSVGAHIHEGAKGVAGPVVVPFSAPDATGIASGCTTPDAALVTRIMQHPENFYVNVHTPDFPAGAIRGQLTMATGDSATNAAPPLPTTGIDARRLATIGGYALLVGIIGWILQRRARPRRQRRYSR